MKKQILLCIMTILFLLCLYPIGMNKDEQKNNVSQIEYLSGQMVDKKEINEASLQEHPDRNSWIKIDSTRMDYSVMQKKIIPTFKIMTFMETKPVLTMVIAVLYILLNHINLNHKIHLKIKISLHRK